MIELAISPCPNDTFIFGPWALGKLDAPPPHIHFADIEQLNNWALTKKFPLIKVSIACMSKLPDYELLPVGAALGFHVGPKIIAKKPYSLEDLPRLTLAIPGAETTAHLLLQKLCPEPGKKHFCLFHEISNLLNADIVDAGLIIHESRFTFAKEGFVEIADLGELWHQRFSLPLPLGGLAMIKNHPLRNEVITILQKSYDFACSHTKEIMPFILEHAQVKEAVLQHIETYVTDETRELSFAGWKAMERLTDGKVTRLCFGS